MGHQPFEEWIVDDYPISQEQSELLQTHLKQCPKCAQLSSSWTRAEAELIAAGMISPAPGFVNRFQSKLIAKKAEEFQMQSVKSLLIIGSTLLFVTGTLIAWLFATKSVGEIIVGGVSFLTGLTEAFFNLRFTVLHFFQNIPPYVLILVLILAIGWGMIMALVWGLTIWRFSRREVEQK
jgi:hypothetical protein